MSGRCVLVNSTTDSLTFTWRPAASATYYRLVGDGVDTNSSTNTITVYGLTPGSHYTFLVWAVDSQGVVSNSNIICDNSTGTLRFVLAYSLLLYF